MSWNYRIVRYRDGSGFGLHEVYYDDNRRPWGMSESPVSLWCDRDEGPEGIEKLLNMARTDARLLDILDEFETWPGQTP